MQFSMAVIVDRLSMVDLKHSGLKFASDSLKSWIERTTELSDTCTHDDDTNWGRKTEEHVWQIPFLQSAMYLPHHKMFP